MAQQSINSSWTRKSEPVRKRRPTSPGDLTLKRAVSAIHLATAEAAGVPADSEGLAGAWKFPVSHRAGLPGAMPADPFGRDRNPAPVPGMFPRNPGMFPPPGGLP